MLYMHHLINVKTTLLNLYYCYPYFAKEVSEGKRNLQNNLLIKSQR